ncbi:MAG TPA: HD domain-containing phosphohydrolase [Candidatus Sulfopaludibacter sp.]|nr:HD domain-containing phosphohydrolase [Candidatus Sulfopaludibacter sp.]
MIRFQHKLYNGQGLPAEPVKGDLIPLSSRLLKILDDMAQLQAGGLNRARALDEMQHRQGWYDPSLLDAVRTCHGITATARNSGR